MGLEILAGAHREVLIPGVELMDRLGEMAEDQGKTVYFFRRLGGPG